MQAIIPDNSLSVKAGGIAPLGEERDAHAYKQVIAIAKKHKISLDKPVKDLRESHEYFAVRKRSH
ncbi:MAG: hypothetical protein WKF88_08060 [Ferruginibacter sp.]